MSTPLTLNSNQDASTTLATADKMVATQTGTTSSGVTTKVGTSTGWGQIYAQGNTGAWPALGAIGSPDGHGWLQDDTSLEAQTILAGNWQWAEKARVTAGTATIDMVVRYYKYNAGTYTLIASITLAGQAFTSTQAIYTSASTAEAAMSFGTGDKLYKDVWLNITANGTGSTSASFAIQTCNNAGAGLSGIAQTTTPGYQATGNPVVYSDSPYGVTINVSNNKTALSYEKLQLFASFTNGGTIPFTIRYQYQWKYIETAQGVYGGWGPLDETVDKVNAIPGLKLMLPLQGAPSWWCNIDANGNNVGYGNGILPDGPAMAAFAAVVAQRYGNRIAFYQVGNEEWDTLVHSGAILAPVFNYAYPAIKQYASSPVGPCSVRRLPPGGAHVTSWMNGFFQYTPQTGEPAQALPDFVDFHYYRDGSTLTSTGNPSPDPATTDNSLSPGSAATPAVQDEIALIAAILATYSPNTQIWNLESGWDLPNNNPSNKSNSPSDLPSQQSRYTRTLLAQAQNAGAKKAFLYTTASVTDPKGLCAQAITDLTSHIIANPQWGSGFTAPANLLYQSVDALSFEGSTQTAPADQYFSIMNPTSGSLSWSIASNQTWLTSQTMPTNGINGNTGGGLTSGTLAAGQCITLKASCDSTQGGLTQLSALSGTLTVTIGSNVSTIAISLFVTPTAANPSVTEAQTTATFNMTAGGSVPGSQAITFTNADAYASWWYAFATGNWFSLDVASGNLGSGSVQTINVSLNSSVVSTLGPGTYSENLTISLTPFPPTYTTNAPPPTVQFVTVIVKLVIAASATPVVQLSTGAMQFSAAASGSLPPNQTFYVHNCTNVSENWSAAITYGSGSGWLSVSPTSGTGLPANGSTTGSGVNVQSTDYAIVTASITSTALSAGTYTATITVTLGGTATATITVTYIVNTVTQTMIIGVSPTSVSLTQVQAGSAVSTNVTLTNTGNTSGTWTHTNSYGVGSGWLTVSPGTGTLAGSGGTQTVTITCTPGPGRVPNTYTATVTFTLGTTTATLTVTFTITPASTGATLSVTPTALSFSAVLGGANPTPQTVTVANTGGSGGTWTSGIVYSNGSGWLSLSPAGGSLTAGGSTPVALYCDNTGLGAGTYTALVTLSGVNQVTVSVSFVVAPQAPPAGGTFSNLLSLGRVKVQVVKVYSSTGQYLGIWKDAPLLTGYKMTMNAASSQIKMLLPRKLDSFGGAGQPGTDNTVVLGNTVQIWLYGPGLPTTGLLKFNGIIDTIEPTIDEHNGESVTVTLTPYDSVVADHGYPGSLQLSFVEALVLFTYWFTHADPTPGLGGVTYANPLTLDPSNPLYSGLIVNYLIKNQNIKSVFDVAMSMLGLGWFWRINPNLSLTFGQYAQTAQHTLMLGQHLSSLSGFSDNNQRKNVICFVGASGISATAVGPSALPVAQGGIGERIYYAQDSRITDNTTASIVARGLLTLYDQVLIRTKCRVFDYRGDTASRLGFDIESLKVGDTVVIKDSRATDKQTTWGNFKYGQAQWGASPGVAFNSVVPILSIDYNWHYVDLELGTFQPNQDRSLFELRKKLNDFSVGWQ